jgi:hypothetical protein
MIRQRKTKLVNRAKPNEVNHVWFPRQGGAGYPTFENTLITDETIYNPSLPLANV